MPWYSIYGTGALVYGIEHDLEGRVEFTVWLCVFWVPLLPVSSWSARYVGNLGFEELQEERRAFIDLTRIPHHWPRLLGTFLSGLCSTALAIAPTAYLIVRTEGRAATTFEMIFVFASILWTAGFVFFVEHQRTEQLRGR